MEFIEANRYSIRGATHSARTDTIDSCLIILAFCIVIILGYYANKEHREKERPYVD